MQLVSYNLLWFSIPHKSNKKEGKRMKKNLNQEVNSNVFANDESCPKSIIICSLTALSVTPLYHDLPAYTVKLATRMNSFAKKNKINVTVDVSSFQILILTEKKQVLYC